MRRQKKLTKKQQEEDKKLEQKIALEERKILIAQRKLESIRLLEELFNRVKVKTNLFCMRVTAGQMNSVEESSNLT